MDQFIQVKCKFQLTSESESSETIHTNCERVRLCTSVHLDENSSLLVLVCSNDVGNNHIVVYHVERRLNDILERQIKATNTNNTCHNTSPTALESRSFTSTTTTTTATSTSFSSTFSSHNIYNNSQNHDIKPHFHHHHHNKQNQYPQPNSSRINAHRRTRPRIRVKQIYYHPYNEDIVAISLSESGNKLVFISSSSIIYVLPIKNILLKLHVKQSRSSQGKSMYFYDASILNCCTIEEPISLLYWEPTSSETYVTSSYMDKLQQKGSQEFYSALLSSTVTSTPKTPQTGSYSSPNSSKSAMIIVANKIGQISIINVDYRKQINIIQTKEKIKSISLIRDRFSISVLINCQQFKQLRLPLELIRSERLSRNENSPNIHDHNIHNHYRDQVDTEIYANEELIDYDEDELIPSPDRKPIPINIYEVGSPNGLSNSNTRTRSAVAALRSILMPSSINTQSSIFSSLTDGRERHQTHGSILYDSTNGLICMIDTLGNTHHQTNDNSDRSRSSPNSTKLSSEARLFRFYNAKQFYYRHQKAQVTCKLNSLDQHEQVTHVVLTDRFLVIATDRDRCLINSRNCSSLRNPNPSMDLDPLIKEIKFTNQEKILHLIKSPATNDLDGIIDSFLLVTDRSIYSLEARQSCRNMFIGLIDSHLGIRHERRSKRSAQETCTGFYFNEYCMIDDTTPRRKDSETNILLVSNFLNHRGDVYEKVTFDSRVFSMLFKIELNSLYEVYGDKLLLRKQFTLANRFFHMAKFDCVRTMGKYIRLGAYNQTIDYVTNLLNDENQIISEKERVQLSKAAFECLLAKTIVERCKMLIHKTSIKRWRLSELLDQYERSIDKNQNTEIIVDRIYNQLGSNDTLNSDNKVDPFKICEHSPWVQEARLSTNTIIVDDEGTLTEAPTMQPRKYKDENRFECGKALVRFVNDHLPQSLYSHVLSQLVAFGLLDLAESLAESDFWIYSLIKIILAARDENRMVFRSDRYERLVEKLTQNDMSDLVQLQRSKPQYFDNVYIMKLLEKFLSLLPSSTSLDAISDCLGIDDFMGQVPLPTENVWRQILKTIQTAALKNE